MYCKRSIRFTSRKADLILIHFHSWIFCFKFFLEDISPFLGATDASVLDFCWCLPWVSKPGQILHAMDSSDSPLVWHLQTSWQSALQLNHLDRVCCTVCALTVSAIPVRLSFMNLHCKYRLCRDQGVVISSVWCRQSLHWWKNRLRQLHWKLSHISLHCKEPGKAK